MGLNLGEFDPATGQNIDDEVEEMLTWVRSLAAEAMLMAHTLSEISDDQDSNTTALSRCAGVLPCHVNATAEAALSAVECLKERLLDAGILLDTAPVRGPD